MEAARWSCFEPLHEEDVKALLSPYKFNPADLQRGVLDPRAPGQLLARLVSFIHDLLRILASSHAHLVSLSCIHHLLRILAS